MNDAATTENKSTKPRKFTRKTVKKEKVAETVDVAAPAKPRRKKSTKKVVKPVREKASRLTRFETLRSAKADHVLAASSLIEIRKMLAKAEKDEVKALDKHNKARVAFGLLPL
jgi:hypothetical protein